MPQTLNVEFGSTAGSEKVLSVKLRVPEGQVTQQGFRDLFCNGVLAATLSVGGKQQELFPPQEAYHLQGRFQVEGFSTFEGEHKLTLSCNRWSVAPHDWAPDTIVATDWYAVWGMWSALANKSGTLEVERVGKIERKPVGRPRKNADDQEQCDEDGEMESESDAA